MMINRNVLFVCCMLIQFMAFNSCSKLRNFTRPVIEGIPDEKDAIRNPFKIIENDTIAPVYQFTTAKTGNGSVENIIIEDKSFASTGVTLSEFVHLQKTLSFAIIRNDSILYEFYSSKLPKDNRVTSFSIAKSFIAMLVGIAINEGKIKSVNQPITDFILKYRDDTAIQKISIKNLLQHTSGIKFNSQKLNPWSDNAEYYYANNLRERSLNIEIKETPGLRFDYQSENTMLLALILEKATGMSVSEYLEKKIWTQIGMEAPATWNKDRKDSLAIERAFCCLNARTLDFARFGRLLLHHGNWNGKQIIPKAFIDEATTPSTSDGGKQTYGYNLGIGPKEYGTFFPIGLFGQLIYVYPKKNVIIVRFGESELSYHPNYWKEVMLQIIDQL